MPVTMWSWSGAAALIELSPPAYGYRVNFR
jgi:hypothetical protein